MATNRQRFTPCYVSRCCIKCCSSRRFVALLNTETFAGNAAGCDCW